MRSRCDFGFEVDLEAHKATAIMRSLVSNSAFSRETCCRQVQLIASMFPKGSWFVYVSGRRNRAPMEMLLRSRRVTFPSGAEQGLVAAKFADCKPNGRAKPLRISTFGQFPALQGLCFGPCCWRRAGLLLWLACRKNCQRLLHAAGCFAMAGNAYSLLCCGPGRLLS